MLRLFRSSKASKRDLKAIRLLRGEIDAASRHDPTDEHYEQSSVARAIEAFTYQHKTTAEDDQTSSRKSLLWTKLAFCGLVATTLANFWLAIIGHHANVLNKDAGRAWIAPGLIQFLDVPSSGHGFSVQVYYTNVGKEPGKFLNAQGKPVVVHVPNAVTNWATFDNPTFDTCPAAKMLVGSSVTYPSTSQNHEAWIVSSDVVGVEYREVDGTTATPAPDLYAGIVSGQFVVTINGCAGYTTLGIRRISRYCFLLVPSSSNSIKSWNWAFCKNGNDAS